MSKAGGSRYFPSLDGLRCLAVGIVMAAHAHVPPLRSGGVGVDIFFVLSGFLISSILFEEYSRHGRISFGRFYMRRFLRLTPCLWTTVAFFVIVHALLGDPFPVKDSALALTYTMNWACAFGYQGEFDGLMHTWSLAIEEQFYLLWPLLFGTLVVLARSRARLALILGIAAIGVGAYRYFLTGHYSAERIYYGLDTHCDGLLCGAMLVPVAAYLRESALPQVVHTILGRCLVPLALCGIAVIACKLHWSRLSMQHFGFTASAGASGVIVLDLVAGRSSLLRGVLELAPLRWLGKISYGLYLWHFPIYELIARLDVIHDWWWLAIIGPTCTVAMASLSYYSVERYFLRLKTRFHAQAPAARAPAANAA